MRRTTAPPMNVASTLNASNPALRLSLALLVFLSAIGLSAASERRVLVYTKNGKGYVHDNIAASVAAIKKLGAENNFLVDVSDDPAVFTTSNLRRYNVVIFDNANNEIFDNEAQKAALRSYLRGPRRVQSPKGAEQAESWWGGLPSGGGFVGIHSASGAERDWPWFWEVLGGKF